MTLKQLRKKNNLTQKQCAAYLEIPLRTYQNYENDVTKSTSFKYLYMKQKMEQYGIIDEENGILSINDIIKICSKIFKDKDINFCYLFGSYSKNKATQKSDIDLLISTSITGIDFFDIVEELREKLNKKVDVLNLEQINNNLDLINEILKDGIKIYG